MSLPEPKLSAPAVKRGQKANSSSFDELDKVKLTKPITSKGHSLAPGRIGTIVYCHGTAAYEVEFPDIHDFFQISAGSLTKA